MRAVSLPSGALLHRALDTGNRTMCGREFSVGFDPVVKWEDRPDVLLKDECAVCRSKAERHSAPAAPKARPPQARCVACGDPVAPGSRWCSRSCHRAEDLLNVPDDVGDYDNIYREVHGDEDEVG